MATLSEQQSSIELIRQDAREQFEKIGFPNSHDEDWKFTSLSAVAKLRFEPVGSPNLERAAELLRDLPVTANRIVFVNGKYMSTLSTPGIASTFSGTPTQVLELHLARHADYLRNAFTAWNTSALEDGGFVFFAARRVVEEPVHVVYLSVPGDGPSLAHPRNLIVVGARSQVSIIESHLGVDTYMSNAVTEVVVSEDAVVDFTKLQNESASAFHIAAMHVDVGAGASFQSRVLSFGGSLARTQITAVLEEGATCTLNGLYVTRDRQHADNRTTIDHAKPHATSHELYKGILDGASSAVFNGKIIVRKDAQKTDAKQTNKNLVLSEGATINTKPQLEIFADDVRCTHGATVGQLDRESIFYLQSRGIDREAAREMLTYAFAQEIIDAIRNEPFRVYAGHLLAGRLAREATV